MNEDRLRPKTLFLILSGITVIGILLRFYHLNFQSLWYDELHSIIPTDPVNSLSSVIEYCKGDQPPAFFIYLYYFFHLFGYNEVVGRVASALVGVVSIPVIYFLGMEIKGQTVGLFAALLTSLNYMHIYYSQELRFYSMAFLFTALSFLFLIKAFKRLKVIDFAWYVFFTTALLYTHYYGLVIYGVQVIAFFILLIYKRDKRFIIGSIISGILIVVLFIPWLPVILGDLEITSFWIRKPKPTFIVEYFYYYFGKDAFVTAVFIFFTALFLKRLFGKSKLESELKSVYVILMTWVVFSYLIPYVKSIIGLPMLLDRYTIVSLPAWLLIFSIGWDEIKTNRWRYGIAIALSLSMVFNLFFVRKHYVRIEKQQFREASDLVKTKNLSSYPIFSAFPWHFNYYFRNYPLKSNDLNLTALSKVDAFWLLHAEFFSPEEENELIRSLQGQFEVFEKYPFNKTEALLMKRIKQ